LLKFGRGKENLFAVFPIGATMQDGGKRKRSPLTPNSKSKNKIINRNEIEIEKRNKNN